MSTLLTSSTDSDRLCSFQRFKPGNPVFGQAVVFTVIDQQLNLQAVRVVEGREAEQKAAFVNQLGADKVIAIGQGANDAAMLKAAIIGIGLVSLEGIAVDTLLSADIIVPDIHEALELLNKPLRIVASLRK